MIKFLNLLKFIDYNGIDIYQKYRTALGNRDDRIGTIQYYRWQTEYGKKYADENLVLLSMAGETSHDRR